MTVGVSRLANLPVSLPTQPLPDNVNVRHVASQFADVLTRLDQPSTFVNDAVWRDTFCITGTQRTFYSALGVAKAWSAACQVSATPVDGSLNILADAATKMELPMGNSWVEISGSFQTKTVHGLVGKCTLMIGAVYDRESWKIWSLRTLLDDVEGWPSVNECASQDDGATTNGHKDDVSHTDRATQPLWFDAVVVGAGQSGLSAAGRLEALGVHYLLLDKYDEVGDSWATRYDSARVHTTRDWAHLPFGRTFPKHEYQEFLTKDDLARGHRAWAQKFGINEHIWIQTELTSGQWDEATQSWTLQLLKHGHNETIRTRFVVMAIGLGGQIPSMPSLPGRESHHGLVMHSKEYTSPKEWAGRSAIVVGTANTAHDIADDMYEAGMSRVTMIQRSKTWVLPYEYWQKFSDQTYNPDFPTDLADKLSLTGPQAVGRLMLNGQLDLMADAEPHRFEALSRAGFDNDRYGDLLWHLFERGGGHYMDIGTSQKIVDGKIKVKKGTPTHYTTTGLALDDGTEVPADIIVWATGFSQDQGGSVEGYFGPEVAKQIKPFFSIDDEGEAPGAWKILHPGLLTHGSGQNQARFLSKYIALQIKAVLDNKPFVVYADTPVPMFDMPAKGGDMNALIVKYSFIQSRIVKGHKNR